MTKTLTKIDLIEVLELAKFPATVSDLFLAEFDNHGASVELIASLRATIEKELYGDLQAHVVKRLNEIVATRNENAQKSFAKIMDILEKETIDPEPATYID